MARPRLRGLEAALLALTLLGAAGLPTSTLAQGQAAGAGGAVAAGASSAPGTAGAAPALRLCLAEDNAPLSYWAGGQARGLDVRIAEAVAARLQRPLTLVPFETAFEKESTLTHEVNALLSSGVCEAAGGFPLLRDDLGAPSRPSARVPDHPGAPRRRERPYVPLGELVASRAYLAAALGLVERVAAADAPPPSTTLGGFAAEGTRRLGVTTGTLAGSTAMLWRQGALKSRLVAVGQRDDLLAQLARPDAGFDAALVPLALFDGWKRLHPQAPLAVSSWRRPIGVNLGFVSLQGRSDLQQALDAVIAEALASGQLARWATAEGVSYTPPTAPEVSRGPSLRELAAD